MISKAQIIRPMEKFSGMVKNIHAADKMSLITYENFRAAILTPRDKEHEFENSTRMTDKSRKFLAWGDKTIIDGLS